MGIRKRLNITKRILLVGLVLIRDLLNTKIRSLAIGHCWIKLDRSHANARCVCGIERIVYTGSVVRGDLESCGCTWVSRYDEFLEMLNAISDNEQACVVWPYGKGGYQCAYGTVRKTSDSPKEYVHRLAFELRKGPLPEGLLACHHCDNPPCFNPNHLFAGTDKDNSDDKIRKGRFNHRAWMA